MIYWGGGAEDSMANKKEVGFECPPLSAQCYIEFTLSSLEEVESLLIMSTHHSL